MIKSKLKQVIFCSTGSTIEWYDFSVFAVLSPIISRVFFMSQTHFDAMLYTFMVFASGYLMRPIGAIFFGYIGDKIGRKTAMMSTIWLMAFSTFLIAMIPTGKAYSGAC